MSSSLWSCTPSKESEVRSQKSEVRIERPRFLLPTPDSWLPKRIFYVQRLSETQETGRQYRNLNGTVWHVYSAAFSTRLWHHHRQQPAPRTAQLHRRRGHYGRPHRRC